MNVYVACSSAHRDIAQGVMEALRNGGHEIAIDWTEGFSDSPPRDPGEYGAEDLDALDEADALLYVATATPSEGASVELGYALGKEIPVLGLFPDHRSESQVFLFQSGIEWFSAIQDILGALDDVEASLIDLAPITVSFRAAA